MVRDVAVYEPGTGVVGLESNDDVAVLWKENDVPAWRIVECEVETGWEGVGANLLQNGEIMTVEMDLRPVSTKEPYGPGEDAEEGFQKDATVADKARTQGLATYRMCPCCATSEFDALNSKVYLCAVS
jgi:hypothetical protein